MPTRPSPPPSSGAPVTDPKLGFGAWVVLPTYDEAENIGPVSAAILGALPGATLLVVDDSSPDGTGRARRRAGRRRSRASASGTGPAKQGLGRAYLDGFRVALDGGAERRRPDGRRLVSHDPAVLPSLVAPIDDGRGGPGHRLALHAGGGVVDWGIGRRVISRGGQHVRADVLRPRPHDLTGGFKAWRASTLAAVPFDGVHAGGYVFQIEMTYRASRAGARIREVPIMFRDRRVGQSKMSRRIIVEALVVVVQPALGGAARPVRRRRQRRAGDEPADVRSERRPRPSTAAACASSSTRGRSRNRTARRSPPPTSRGCWAPSTPTRSRASRSRSSCSPTSTTRRRASTRLEVVGRRLAAADPPAALRRADGRPVPAARRRRSGRRWRAERGGAGGAVYHAAGGGRCRSRRGLPVVVTLLDLAPWELPAPSSATPRARFGQRLRGRLLRDAAAVIVGTEAVGAGGPPAAARPARADPRRPARPAPAARARDAGRDAADAAAAERERLGLRRALPRLPGRYDARQDSPRSAALAALAAAGRPPALPEDDPWPPRILLVGATPDDRAALARAAAREGVGERSPTRRSLPDDRLAALVRGARAAILPVLSEAAGLAAIDALAGGTPVVASAVGALPELVGAAGILVEPREPGRLAAALRDRLDRRRASTRGSPAAARDAGGRSDGRGPTSPPRPARVYAEVGAYRLTRASATSAARWPVRPPAATLPFLMVTFVPVASDLDERLADGQRDLRCRRRRRTGSARSISSCARCP